MLVQSIGRLDGGERGREGRGRMSHIPTQGQKGSIGEGESDLVVSPSLSFSVHLTHTLLIFHLDQRPLLVYKSRAKAPGATPADGQMPRCRICIAEELVCSGGRRDGERGYKLPLSFHVAVQTFDNFLPTGFSKFASAQKEGRCLGPSLGIFEMAIRAVLLTYPLASC